MKLSNKEYLRQWRAKNREKCTNYNKKHYQDNKERCNKRSSDHYQANKEQINKRISDYRKEHREELIESDVLKRSKHRAKRDNIPFNIDVSDIFIPEVCPILQIPIIISTGKPSPNSPSLDKIIPELGYVKGNVQIISNKANMMKNNATFEEMMLLGEWAKRARNLWH